MSGKITSMEVQERNTGRVNIYIDNEFAFGLNLIDAASLHKGQVLSDAEIATLKAGDEVSRLLDKALRFLAHRPRSIAEVRRNLQQRNTPASFIDEVIERLQSLNYVNDLEFARYWMRNREEFNPRGERALRYELRQKGIDNATIDTVLADVDAEASAYRAAQKKVYTLRGKDRETIWKQLGGFLARRGFDYEVVRAVIDRVINELEENEEVEPFHDDE